MKIFLYLLILLLVRPAFLRADPKDTSKHRLKAELIQSYWVYGECDSQKIRFKKSGKFEYRKYSECDGVLNRVAGCEYRKRDEVSVYAGSWFVRSDTVYLTFKQEKIYKLGEFIRYERGREIGEKIHRPRPVSKCGFRIKYKYTFSEHRLHRGSDLNIF